MSYATDRASGLTQIVVTTNDDGSYETARVDVADKLTLQDLADANASLDSQITEMKVLVAVPSDLSKDLTARLKKTFEENIASPTIRIDAVIFPVDVAEIEAKAKFENAELQKLDTQKLNISADVKTEAVAHNLKVVRLLKEWASGFSRQVLRLGSEANYIQYARYVPYARGTFTAVTWCTLSPYTWQYGVALGAIDVIADALLIKNDRKFDAVSTSWPKKFGSLGRLIGKNDVINASVFGFAMFGLGYRFLQRSVGSTVDWLSATANQKAFFEPQDWAWIIAGGALTWGTRAPGRLALRNLTEKGYMSPNWQTYFNGGYSFYAQVMAVTLLSHHTNAMLALGSIVWVGQPLLYLKSRLLPSRKMHVSVAEVPGVSNETVLKDLEAVFSTNEISVTDFATAATKSRSPSSLKKFALLAKEIVLTATNKISALANQCQSTFY